MTEALALVMAGTLDGLFRIENRFVIGPNVASMLPPT